MVKKCNTFFVSCGVIAVFALPSFAWGDISTDDMFELSMDELLDIEIEIATGKSQKLSLAPAVANVITAADIKAMGVTEFRQVLEMIPGVHHYPDPLGRLDPHFSIRGIHTTDNSQVLVLVDGHDITYAVTGSSPSGFRLSVANIARVEVMRSPGSALYGADAFAGVINVITKSASEINGTQFGWRRGSFNTQDIWLQGAVRLDNEWDLSVSLESSSSDGDDGRVIDYNDEIIGFTGRAPLETHYDYTNAQIFLSNQEWEFKLWNWNLNDAGTGQGAAFIPSPTDFDKAELSLLDIQNKKQNVFPGLSVNSRLSYEVQELDSQFLIFPAFGSFVDGMRGYPGATQYKGMFSVRADYSGFQRHRLLVGVGSEWLEVDPREAKNFDSNQPPLPFGSMLNVTGDPDNIFMLRQARTVNHLSLQYEWEVNEAWAVTTGIRYDDYSDFGSTTNPRLAVIWRAHQKLTTKILYGRAFRAPSFSELYFINNPSVLGNPDVNAEQIETYEAVIDYRPVREFNLVLSIFDYRIEDLIDRSGVAAHNIGKQDGSGFELEANWHVNAQLQLRGFYAFQNSEDGVTGADVPNAPQQQFYTSAHWGFQPQWSLGTQLKWIADRKRAADDDRPDIADYTVVDTTLRRRNLLPNMDFSFSVRNVFDEDVREPSVYDAGNSLGAAIANDYPMPGRSAYAEVSFNY
ncbi:MAG: TonB-dependent receptor [Thiotrichales bacterium]|nr:MAG: TonB-dependent receptor [Thiotrichales bacterium]